MSPTADHLLFETFFIATTAAADINVKAVVLAGQSAAFVSFRWQPATQPPTQNDHSADSSLLTAVQLSGSNAIFVATAAIVATTATFGVIR